MTSNRFVRRAYRILHPRESPPRRQLLLDQLPRGAVGAEIGVWKGDFSARILEQTKPTLLHLIDPWHAATEHGYEQARYGGLLADGQRELEAVYEDVLKRFDRERRKGVVVVHRLTSDDAVSEFRDGSLDFVYVDGNHRYAQVKSDLDAYAYKVRAGGFLAGDDYGVVGWWEDGVTRAVDEFAGSGRATVVSLENAQFLLRIPDRCS